jgi:hypothetical protein
VDVVEHHDQPSVAHSNPHCGVVLDFMLDLSHSKLFSFGWELFVDLGR